MKTKSHRRCDNRIAATATIQTEPGHNISALYILLFLVLLDCRRFVGPNVQVATITLEQQTIHLYRHYASRSVAARSQKHRKKLVWISSVPVNRQTRMNNTENTNILELTAKQIKFNISIFVLFLSFCFISVSSLESRVSSLESRCCWRNVSLYH